MWGASVAGPANQSTEDVEMLKQLWKPNLEIYGLQVRLLFSICSIVFVVAGVQESSHTKWNGWSQNIQIKSDDIWHKSHDRSVLSHGLQWLPVWWPLLQLPGQPVILSVDMIGNSLQVGSYFYDKNSVTCSSTFQGPTKASRKESRTERSLQHTVNFTDLPKSQRIVR